MSILIAGLLLILVLSNEAARELLSVLLGACVWVTAAVISVAGVAVFFITMLSAAGIL